ncbi:MarR family winged helix-turn-helix transcriptional regulator [Variovorax sp. M-6]|uniref:MarR family winged helix-turn-helix transcriptional regulator n=1 Tax=Variovorax sp. M-6 TaxID=3233041 RepID=UPI003F9862A2
MTVDALAFCLGIGRAHASLSLRLEEDLGAFHGLSFGDFTLLHGLLHADQGRMRMTDLAQLLGLPMSALMRKMVVLEKTGLAERLSAPGDEGRRHAAIRTGGRKVMLDAIVTVEAICTQAVQALDPARLAEINAAMLALCGDEASRA